MTEADTAEPGQRTRRGVSPWPRTPLDWVKVVAMVMGLILVAVAAVQYIGYLERQRCRDSIVGRHDLRAAFPAVVAYIVEETSSNPDELSFVVEGVAQVMADKFGHPDCAERWGIDPMQVLRDRRQMDPADPLVAEELGIDPIVRPAPPPSPPATPSGGPPGG